MKRAWLVLSALILVAIGGCQQEVMTTTPSAATFIERSNLATTVSLLTLARSPSAFEGEDLRLSGNYRPVPLPVCAGEAHPSPATWVLSDGAIEIPMAGFDGALRDLVPVGLPMEVEGRWQKWEGPIGCGRRLPSETIWYLQLTNIVSPNPLTAFLELSGTLGAPITPTLTGDAIASGDLGTDGVTATTTGSSESPGTVPTATPTLDGSETPQSTVTFASTASVTRVATVTPFPTLTVSVTPTPTPTGTPTTGTSTPTPTATTAAGSSPTPTVDSGRAILVNYDDLSKRTVAAGGVQSWQFAGSTDLPITVHVAPARGLNVSLELIGPNGDIVGTYDQAGTGQVETISEQSLPVAGLYTIEVSSVGQTAGSYALVLQSDSSRPLVFFQGTMAYGQTRAATTPVDGNHLWNFEGEAGDVVNIRVNATTANDMQIYLNNHGGAETEFVNDNTVYAPPADREEILGFRLPATGLYTVGIGDEDLDSLGYTISIERAS